MARNRRRRGVNQKIRKSVDNLKKLKPLRERRKEDGSDAESIEIAEGISSTYKRIAAIVGFSVLFSIAGYKIVDSIRDKTKGSVNGVNSSNNVSASATTIKRRKSFDCRTYQPPAAEGEILAKDCKPDNNKTIVFIMDVHPLRDITGTIPQFTHEVQRQVFRIVKAAVDEYGDLPLALEMMPSDYSAKQLKDKMTSVVEEKKGISLVRSQERSSKIRLAEKMFDRKTGVTAGALLTHIFTDEITPIGTNTYADIMDAVNAKNNLDILLWTLKNDADNLRCKNTFPTVEGDLTLEDANQFFQSNKKNQIATNCYCSMFSFDHQLVDFMNKNFYERVIEEIDEAVKPDGNFSFLITGAAHSYYAVPHMKMQHVNYILVSPNSAKELSQRYKTEEFRFDYTIPDNEDAECQKWRIQNPDKDKFIGGLITRSRE